MEALRIVEVQRVDSIVAGEPSHFTVGLEDGKDCQCTTAMTARMEPRIGDYLVRVPQPGPEADSVVFYEYLNPKAVFEAKYDPVPA